jgi:Methyltransferase domain.
MGSFEQNILSERRKFLLQDITPPVLEIGAGTGANLFCYPFFNKDFRLTIIEKNPFMVEKIKQKFPEISSRIDFIVDSIENQSLINHLPKFNSIVSTLTLCSVNDLGLTISHIKQLLEKQGIFYLIEHIRSKKKFLWNIPRHHFSRLEIDW